MNLTDTHEYRKSLGSKMARLRDLRKVTQMDVAYAIGYNSTGMLSKIEAGLSGMSYEQICKAAEFFGIHPAVLMTPQDYTDDELQMIVNLMKLLKDQSNPHYQSIKSLLDQATR